MRIYLTKEERETTRKLLEREFVKYKHELHERETPRIRELISIKMNKLLDIINKIRSNDK